MTIHQDGLFVQPARGRSYYFGQDLYTFKAIGEETEEAYALCEVIVAPQGGTSGHRHSRENESFYVLDGEIEFQLDDTVPNLIQASTADEVNLNQDLIAFKPSLTNYRTHPK